VGTALALLAIGLGLIALFGIGRLALESSREAENDRRCAMMADAIFETLRAVNTIYIDEARTNGWNVLGSGDPNNTNWTQPSAFWNILWEQDNNGNLIWPQPLPLPLGGNVEGTPWWSGGSYFLFPPVAGMRSMVTNDVPLIWNWNGLLPAYNPGSISLANWNPLYQLGIIDVDDYRYYSPAAGTFSAKKVILAIYPDGFSGSSDPRIYTTTLSNTGGMP